MWREIFRTPTAVLLMLVFIGANFVAMTFLTWMPTFLGEKFGLKLTMAGLEVGSVTPAAAKLDYVVVGEIRSVAAHPAGGGRHLVHPSAPLGRKRT